MEINSWKFLLDIPILFFLILLIIIPIFIFKKLTFSIENKLAQITLTFALASLFSIFLTFIFTYYVEELSKNFILNKFGYNANGMNDSEYFQNVKPENVSELKEIRDSQMGIGWPLKAIFATAFFTLPINLVTTLIIIFRKSKYQ
ncbi:hypothetical protein [Elizabethkingia sp. JS20170427COW]|uniref:hypothetical protein n=1 Tax=Elizabethkingia sp. JS20170427COW TaxID=2583851 RepID=UPI001110EACE|nr:hypothetical protein [Elizabethkingia sp. JS20170427COW]QCX54380.1 hypothetical protein FGE20_11830 [Elizabethkingia sp. JS20170427COW]